jgi:hypothetical protein
MLIDAVVWFMGENDGNAEIFRKGSEVLTSIGRGRESARIGNSQADFLGQALGCHLSDLVERAIFDPTPSAQS